MLSVREAQERILTRFQPLEAQTVPLVQAVGRVLARAVRAAIDLPPFDNSSVDGFALRSDDVRHSSQAQPVSLRVVDDIAAGSAPTIAVGSGEAARIMTGAPLPRGADAVVMVEDTDFDDRHAGTPAPEIVQVYHPVPVGAYVRPRAEDLREGDQVLPAARRLRPQDLGLLAMLGAAWVEVHRQPRVAILSSGDELIPVEAAMAPGKVRDANSYTLAMLAEEAGAEVLPLGIAPDEPGAIQALLDQAVDAQADLIVSSAGVSVGALDYVRQVIETHGSLDFWRVNMRPGRPLAFGEFRGRPFFGLPGNPVSAFIGFEVFVRPALAHLSGLPGKDPGRRLRVRLGESLESDGRESYLRAVVRMEEGEFVAHLTGHQGSGNLLSLVLANALLIVPSGVKSLPASAEVDAWLID
ncbi:MAG: molybdopterin molybdotransferase MoeA [Anaerolineales bacterium]|nr:molybdopterin molybdotransferase MoeA [Anaerolineales bacterium]